jgi:CRISPR system Cascade subunit CasA
LRGDLSFVDKAFWDGTELHFYRCLEGLIRQAHSETGINEDDSHFLISFGEAWLSVLAKKSLHLFDVDIVGAGSIAQQNPRRIAEAYKGLERNLSGKAIKTILQIPIVNQTEGPGKQGKSGSVKKNPKTKT